MKRTLLLLFIATLTTASVFADGYDYQVGVGYNGFFMGEEDADPSAYPLGFAVFGGVGFPVTPDIAIGLEYEFSHSVSMDDISDDITIALQEHLPKAYIRFYSYDDLTLTGLIGMDIMVPKVDGKYSSAETGFVLGGRISIGMGYGQYTAVFNKDRTYHRFGFGIKVGNLWYNDLQEDLTRRDDA